MTPEKLKEIRERVEAATPGPWEAMEDDAIAANVDRIPLPSGGKRVSATWIANVDMENRDDYTDELESATAECDKLFIAHARQDVPDLLDALEAAQERNKELERLLNAWLNGFDHNTHLMNSEELRDVFGPMLRQTAEWLREQEKI